MPNIITTPLFAYKVAKNGHYWNGCHWMWMRRFICMEYCHKKEMQNPKAVCPWNGFSFIENQLTKQLSKRAWLNLQRNHVRLQEYISIVNICMCIFIYYICTYIFIWGLLWMRFCFLHMSHMRKQI